jgi:uridine phosphorylase
MVGPVPARLRPTAPNAVDALLVGDPGRALMLAQELLQQPKMSNHARGLWGYTGLTRAGHELTIQSTGMGGPSATIVLHDLAELGVRRAVRIGTCTSLGGPGLGELVIVGEARAGGGAPVQPDASLVAALRRGLPASEKVAVASLDALHRHLDEAPAQGDVVDLQTAALLAAGEKLDVAIAALLLVTETGGGGQIDDEGLEAGAKRAGTATAAILSP